MQVCSISRMTVEDGCNGRYLCIFRKSLLFSMCSKGLLKLESAGIFIVLLPNGVKMKCFLTVAVNHNLNCYINVKFWFRFE